MSPASDHAATDERPRLGELIALAPNDVQQALAEASRDEPALAAVKSVTGFVASLGADELNGALKQDPFELLAMGWVKLKAVRDAAAKSRATPQQTTVLTLGQHDVIAPAYPTLTIYCDGVALTTLKFTLELDARFKSVALAIADGRLRSVAPGEASVLVRLKYKSVKLREQPTPAWKLPGTLTLGAGIPIPS